jgi:TolA-binding protein
MTSIASDCPEDLLVLLRRRALRPEEQSALAQHLHQCPLCRMSAGIRSQVGTLPAVDRDDHALAARLVAGALSPRRVNGDDLPVRIGRLARGRRWLDRRLAVAATALLVMAGSASAAWWHHARTVSTAAPATRKRASIARPRVAAADAPTAPPSANQAAPAPPPAPAVTPPPKSAPFRRVSANAADLFAAASRARAVGDLSRAIALYRELQATFPSSAETKLSWFSLAQVYLKVDQPARAVAQYDAYFASGDATLVEEAIIGKARALSRLGRREEERALWQSLLREHADSEYRWRAEQRLEQLGEVAP